MSRPQVSVVLPTRDRLRTLPRAVRSVLAQTMGDLELIIVDAGSTEGSTRYLDGLDDRRVRVLKAPGLNAAAARNAGIAVAGAPFVAFQDSDDEWGACKLEKQLAPMRGAPHIGLAYCSILRWDGRRVRSMPSPQHRLAPQGDVRHVVRRRDVVATPAWLVRREWFDRAGPFDEALPAVEDWEWLLRFSLEGRAAWIDEPMVVSYESSDSLSVQHAQVARALALIARKHEAQLRREEHRALADLRLVAGVRACLGVSGAEGRTHFARGLAVDPLDPKLLAAWLLSFAGTGAMRRAWEFGRRRRGVN